MEDVFSRVGFVRAYDGTGVRLVKAGEVEEVRGLVEGEEDVAGAENGARGGYDCDAVGGEGGGKRVAPGKVFLGEDAGGEFAWLEEVGVRFVNRLSEAVGACVDGGGGAVISGLVEMGARNWFEKQADPPSIYCFSPSW